MGLRIEEVFQIVAVSRVAVVIISVTATEIWIDSTSVWPFATIATFDAWQGV